MLRDAFAEPAPQREPRAPDPFAGDPFTTSAGGWAETALANEVAILESTLPGGINTQINTSAFNVGQIVAGGDLDYQQCFDALYQAAARASSGDTAGGWIEASLHSGLRSGAKTPRTAPESKDYPAWAPSSTDSAGPSTSSAAPWEATGPVAPSRPTASVDSSPDGASAGDASAGSTLQGAPSTDLGDLVRDNLPRIDWHALWADESEEEWIIEPILPARRLVALYSPPKVGKSLLMLELAAAVAAGRPVLGVVPDRARNVLYVDFENDPKGDIRQRLQRMGYGPDGLANLYYLSFPTLSYLDGAKGGEQLMAAVHVYGAEVVVIDTVSRSVEGEENDNDTWLGFYRHTGLKLKQAGVALIRLDHTGKDETKGQRGGSAKSGDVDAVWRLSTLVRDESYVLTCEINRMPVHEKTLTLYRKESPLRHEVDAAGRAAVGRILEDARIAALKAADCPADVGRPAGSAVLHAAGLTAPKSERWADLVNAYTRHLGAVPWAPE